jgi:acyl carrier protein
MASEEDVLAAIVEILSTTKDLRPRTARTPGAPAVAITLLTRFREDLGFDSLALMSLAFELQERYPDLDELAVATWLTVGDCARSVR